MRCTPRHGNPCADVPSTPANRNQWTAETGRKLSRVALYSRIPSVSRRSVHHLDLIDVAELFTFSIGWRRPHPAAQLNALIGPASHDQ